MKKEEPLWIALFLLAFVVLVILVIAFRIDLRIADVIGRIIRW